MGRIPVNEPVDDIVGESGDPLELRDRKLPPVSLPDRLEEVRLSPGELRLLPPGRPIQQPIQTGCLVKVPPGSNQAPDSGRT